MAKQAVTYDQIIAALQRKEYKPIYMLMGDEPYYIDKIADFIEQNVLTEDEKAFNQTVVYGKDADLGEIIMAAKRFPMMAEHQVIIVKEAQNIKNLDNLVFYLKQPQPSTILVFCYKYGKLDGRKKYTTEIAAKGVLFESKKLLTLIQTMASLSGNTTVSTIGDLSKNYNGVRIGFDLKK